jgi:hypothetical protein
MPSKLDPLWIVFHAGWDSGPLVIPYSIHAANLRENVSQNITVLTEVAEPSQNGQPFRTNA